MPTNDMPKDRTHTRDDKDDGAVPTFPKTRPTRARTGYTFLQLIDE